MGPKRLDVERGMEYPTLARRAVARKLELALVLGSAMADQPAPAFLDAEQRRRVCPQSSRTRAPACFTAHPGYAVYLRINCLFPRGGTG